MTLRDRVFIYIQDKYQCEPEYLWARFPHYAVFRHADNRKWFGLIMNIPREKLGLSDQGPVDILNVKLEDPLLADLLVQQDGYFTGYHIRNGNWVSILLDGTVPFEEICRWIDASFLATASKQKKKKLRPPKEWIIPANPKYYDVEHAFDREMVIDWKQGAGIRAGDTVFMYVAAPVSAILYRCRVMETDIPFQYADENLRISSLMKIRLEKRYDAEAFPFSVLKEVYGIYAVRGPRGVPNSLSTALRNR